MSSSSTKLCFNSNCKDVLERSRKGWRRRTGEFADLCDRCAIAYEEGKFCEAFHLNASGWRCCESCGKQIHCGCIVSFHMFVLLDAGGIECITCARKSFILTPNPAWPPPSLFLPVVPERVKDLSVRNWTPIAGSGPVPWRQAPSLFNASNHQSELHPRIPFEVETPGGMDKFLTSEQLSLDNRRKEDSSDRLMNGGLKICPPEIHQNGATGVRCKEQSKPCPSISQKPSFSQIESSSNHFSSSLTTSKSETNDQNPKNPGVHAQRQTNSHAEGKQFLTHNGVDSGSEAQIRNMRPRGDLSRRNQLLPRYWPKITDQELQQISGDSNSVITPLFEKMLSASDAGRIGRLVLPKKCAEAYFPPISQPEGLPLVVQDLKGKEWVFQFRFWPNNNSRMYVLEGVTPCIQSMQLQAGDVVTFSRLEPEGKLVMGFRKSSTVPADQGNETISTVNGVATHGDGGSRNIKPAEIISTHRLAKGTSFSTSYSAAMKVANYADPSNAAWADVDKSGYIAKEGHGLKPVFRKRKNNALVSKSKRVRFENEIIELKLTWEHAQGLLRPPPNYVPSVVVIEGFEFEEYEDAPVIGRPTISATDHAGQRIQWAQCEDCCKWRKVPDNAIFPSRWTCSDNLWDPERSVCSVAQELTTEQLEDLLSKNDEANCMKMKATKEEPDSLEALEGLDTLANLAIQEEGDCAFTSSSQATTRHPRHRPGCTCIVCIQPPSGKGPKHKPACTCNVCLTVKRRFNTLMLRREIKQLEKDAETAARQKADEDGILLRNEIGTASLTHNNKLMINDASDEDLNKRKSSTSPFKGQIDLNIQPEREEELSPVSDSGGIMRLLAETSERYLKQQQQQLSSSSGNINTIGSPTPLDEVAAANLPNGNLNLSLNKVSDQVEINHPMTSSSMM